MGVRRAGPERGETGIRAAAGSPRTAARAAAPDDRERFEVVSDDADLLVLVDRDDREIGTLGKVACHDGGGVLHRAFSLFVFNPAGETLLQRRHPDKRLWPGYWSNACCSHPRPGEATPEAAVRRAEEELGLAVEPEFAFRFQYRAAFGDVGSEFEVCSVFVCESGDAPRVNAAEIDAWRWAAPDDLDRELAASPGVFTPWFRMEWARLRDTAQHAAAGKIGRQA